MTVKPRTIDQLGIDASIRYAQDKELHDARWLGDTLLVPPKTEIPSATPYAPSEFDQLFLTKSTTLWAFFQPPPEFFSDGRGLFSYQLIPSLGSDEKQDAIVDKLNSQKKRKREEEKEDDGDRKRQKLLALCQCIAELNKTLTMINARRNQYQRG